MIYQVRGLRRAIELRQFVVVAKGRWMTKDVFFSLPDWAERRQTVCDAHGYGSFDRLDATRRAEVITIAKNVADVVPAARVPHSTGIDWAIEKDE